MFLSLQNENMSTYTWEQVENMADRELNPLPVGYLTVAPAHICIRQATNDSAVQHEVCATLAKSGKGKNSIYWTEYVSCEKNPKKITS